VTGASNSGQGQDLNRRHADFQSLQSRRVSGLLKAAPAGSLNARLVGGQEARERINGRRRLRCGKHRPKGPSIRGRDLCCPPARKRKAEPSPVAQSLS